MKKVARHTLIPLIMGLKAYKLLLRRTKHRCMILCLHGVSQFRFPGYAARHLYKHDFLSLLDFIQQEFDVVPAQEIFRWYREGYQPARHTLSLTFDDGLLNNYTHVLPAIETLKIPATFFVATQAITDPQSTVWPVEVDLLAAGLANGQNVQLRDHTFTKTPRGLLSEGLHIYDFFKSLGPQNRAGVIETIHALEPYIRSKNNTNSEFWALMDSETLANLSRSKYVDIGSHAHAHYNLANIPPPAAVTELAKSKDLLEEVLQKPVEALAFPDGNYSQSVRNSALEIGYRDLYALDYAYTEDQADQHILPRLTISHTTTWRSNALRMCTDFDRYGF